MRHLDYILGPPIVGLIFLFLGRPYARLVSAGRPLSPIQRKMLFYGFFFVLGMGYSMALIASLHRQGKWAVVLTVGWGALLFFLALWRHRSTSTRKPRAGGDSDRDGRAGQ
jgi:hypothetical protein